MYLSIYVSMYVCMYVCMYVSIYLSSIYTDSHINNTHTCTTRKPHPTMKAAVLLTRLNRYPVTLYKIKIKLINKNYPK